VGDGSSAGDAIEAGFFSELPRVQDFLLLIGWGVNGVIRRLMQQTARSLEQLAKSAPSIPTAISTRPAGSR
jgi:hypothetical protein